MKDGDAFDAENFKAKANEYIDTVRQTCLLTRKAIIKSEPVPTFDRTALVMFISNEYAYTLDEKREPQKLDKRDEAEANELSSSASVVTPGDEAASNTASSESPANAAGQASASQA